MADLEQRLEDGTFKDFMLPLGASVLSGALLGIGAATGLAEQYELSALCFSIPYILNVDAAYGGLTAVEDDNMFRKGIEPPSVVNKAICSIGAGTIFHLAGSVVGFLPAYVIASILYQG